MKETFIAEKEGAGRPGETTTVNGQPAAGFRLQNLEVLNWGTFHHHCWNLFLDGRNALLTGDIGSGKSTLVDALTCLLVPHNKIVFNKAAGAESKERSLLSYIKGVYKNERLEMTNTSKKVFLRPDDDSYSVIIGNFYNTGYNEHVSLAQVFWMKDGKPEKLLLAGDQPLTVNLHFSGFSDIVSFKKRLRQIPGLVLFDDHFSKYSEHFRHRFGMTSDKAVDLFYQTVSMKAVSSLTDFVREQMLERTDIKEQIDILLKRFDDLTQSHQAVVHAREQYQILKELVEFAVEYGNHSRHIEHIEEILQILPSWFAARKEQLLATSIDNSRTDLHIAEQVLKSLQEQLTGLLNQRYSLLQDIANNGGKRLEQIKEEVTRRELAKQQKRAEWDKYDKLARQCNLPSVKDEKSFFTNIRQAYQQTESCKKQEVSLRDEREQHVIHRRAHQNELSAEQEELQSLQQRRTQIPRWLVDLRQQMGADLEIEEADLPFVGELLRVNEQEAEWEGAIERLLHDTGISMLVPREHYASVRRYVNSNVLRSGDNKGVKLTYLEADIDRKDSYRKELSEDSLVLKLDIQPDTPFFSWIESYLHRQYGDCLCVDVDDLPHIQFGITREGLIKSGKIRHTKDDRRSLYDRRSYVLGWTNEDKIRALEEMIAELFSQIAALDAAIRAIGDKQEKNGQLMQALQTILYIEDFTLINWQQEAEQIHRLESERDELLNNNDLLQALQQKLHEVDLSITETKGQESKKNQDIGGLQHKLLEYQQERTACLDLLSQTNKDLQEKHFPFLDEQLTDQPLRLSSIDSKREQFRKLYEGENGELKKLRSKQTRLTSLIEARMRDIKEHSKAEYSELSIDIENRGEYIDKFNRLANEDLRRHEERFKEELNKHTINSIAVFDSQLERHEKDIKEKIKQINLHLREIVYDNTRGTYIEIILDSSTHKEIRQFREDLKNCYLHALSGQHELYTEEKYERVKKILDRLASPNPVDKEWTHTVTDVRQWFDFNASERFEADNSEKEFIEGSGGKSGGQKEKLAYTILASALAYQFGENRSRSFRFVVIDEAFGKGSDESTRYGLELFQKMGLQLLIVTPLQKLHVIDPYVSSFHFVYNREGNNSQVSTLSKPEYEKEKARRSL